jgi:hypothetical protein
MPIQDVPEQQHAYLLRDFHAVIVEGICGVAPPRYQVFHFSFEHWVFEPPNADVNAIQPE